MTERPFENRHALITGSSSGIGAATARALAARGAYVVIHYNEAANEAAAVLKGIEADGGAGTLLQGKLDTSEGITTFIQAVRALPFGIDILINNAGSLIARTKLLEFTPELWEQVMALNLTSAFFVTQAVLPHMVARGQGAIVNVSSVAARFGGGVGASAYSMAKGAINVFTKALTKEFAEQGIQANAISPGTVVTHYHERFSTEDGLAAVRAGTPVGRLGEPGEIADVIAFLCSTEARFLHGQVIEVNGGFFMG